MDQSLKQKAILLKKQRQKLFKIGIFKKEFDKSDKDSPSERIAKFKSQSPRASGSSTSKSGIGQSFLK